MQVNIQSAQNLFFLPLQYEIPIYQRPYVWDEDRQWQPLWDDVERTAEDILDPPAKGTADHFMGAIVVQGAAQVGAMTKWLVIDGQQRLTTLQILLDAVQLTMRKAGDHAANPANQILSLVENQEFNYDPVADPHLRFKVWPTAGDQAAYETAMTRVDRLEGSLGDEPRLIRAHHFFEQQAEDWLHKDPGQLSARATALALALSQQLKVVAIQLDDTDNPNVIFETLNARGTPLLDWDLAKNFLLHKAEIAGLDSNGLYDDCFRQLEQDTWWREDAARGREYKPRIDLFLYNWLILRTKKLVDAERVFAAFGEYAEGRSITGVSQDLKSVAEFYRAIQDGTGTSAWREFLPRWHTLEAGVTLPLLMWLKEQESENGLSQSELVRCLNAIESYFVRRAVCRIAQRGLNRVFPQLIRALEDKDGSPGDMILAYLSSHSAGLAEWPDDRTFREHLLTGRMYRQLTRRRTRLVLEGLERGLAQESASVIKQHQSLFIEHLLPQTYLPNYPLSKSSMDDEETPQQQRERLLHTLGNLSLTTSKMGIAMGNSGWGSKRRFLKKDALSLNSDVLEHAGENWTDEDIVDRGKRLAELAVQIWPPPEKI